MPGSATSTVQFQVPRSEWLRVWRSRFVRHIRPLRAAALTLLAAGLIIFAAPHSAIYVLIFAIGYIIITYSATFRAMGKALDHQPLFTAPKTVTFNAAGLAIATIDSKAEVPWSQFRKFSEDTTNFYLHPPGADWMVSILPKAAFTEQQREEFRRYAAMRNA